jgi:hypothetical protein
MAALRVRLRVLSLQPRLKCGVNAQLITLVNVLRARSHERVAPLAECAWEFAKKAGA